LQAFPYLQKYFFSKINAFSDWANFFSPAPFCEHAENRGFHFSNGFVVLSSPLFPLENQQKSIDLCRRIFVQF